MTKTMNQTTVTDMTKRTSIRARLDQIDADVEKLEEERYDLRQADLKLRLQEQTSAVTKFRDIQASSVKAGDVVRGPIEGAKGILHVVKERRTRFGSIILRFTQLGHSRIEQSYDPKDSVTVGRAPVARKPHAARLGAAGTISRAKVRAQR